MTPHRQAGKPEIGRADPAGSACLRVSRPTGARVRDWSRVPPGGSGAGGELAGDGGTCRSIVFGARWSFASISAFVGPSAMSLRGARSRELSAASAVVFTTPSGPRAASSARAAVAGTWVDCSAMWGQPRSEPARRRRSIPGPRFVHGTPEVLGRRPHAGQQSGPVRRGQQILRSRNKRPDSSRPEGRTAARRPEGPQQVIRGHRAPGSDPNSPHVLREQLAGEPHECCG
jgi:hypothetical protein